jgi:outer membrane protein OmpA-like peptidoglycan-associated protein
MKTLACIGLGLVATAAAADPAADFVGTSHRTTDRSLAASDGQRPIDPMDIVAFSFDSQALDTAAQSQIARMATWMKDHGDQRLILEGHTDRSGARDYNDDLALRRAEMVRNHLNALGVDPDRVIIAVYGERGANRNVDSLDRKVVAYASNRSVGVIVHDILDDRAAREVRWTDKGTQFTEARGLVIGKL